MKVATFRKMVVLINVNNVLESRYLSEHHQNQIIELYEQFTHSAVMYVDDCMQFIRNKGLSTTVASDTSDDSAPKQDEYDLNFFSLVRDRYLKIELLQSLTLVDIAAKVKELDRMLQSIVKNYRGLAEEHINNLFLLADALSTKYADGEATVELPVVDLIFLRYLIHQLYLASSLSPLGGFDDILLIFTNFINRRHRVDLSCLSDSKEPLKPKLILQFAKPYYLCVRIAYLLNWVKSLTSETELQNVLKDYEHVVEGIQHIIQAKSDALEYVESITRNVGDAVKMFFAKSSPGHTNSSAALDVRIEFFNNCLLSINSYTSPAESDSLGIEFVVVKVKSLIRNHLDFHDNNLRNRYGWIISGSQPRIGEMDTLRSTLKYFQAFETCCRDGMQLDKSYFDNWEDAFARLYAEKSAIETPDEQLINSLELLKSCDDLFENFSFGNLADKFNSRMLNTITTIEVYLNREVFNKVLKTNLLQIKLNNRRIYESHSNSLEQQLDAITSRVRAVVDDFPGEKPSSRLIDDLKKLHLAEFHLSEFSDKLPSTIDSMAVVINDSLKQRIDNILNGADDDFENDNFARGEKSLIDISRFVGQLCNAFCDENEGTKLRRMVLDFCEGVRETIVKISSSPETKLEAVFNDIKCIDTLNPDAIAEIMPPYSLWDGVYRAGKSLSLKSSKSSWYRTKFQELTELTTNLLKIVLNYVKTFYGNGNQIQVGDIVVVNGKFVTVIETVGVSQTTSESSSSSVGQRPQLRRSASGFQQLRYLVQEEDSEPVKVQFDELKRPSIEDAEAFLLTFEKISQQLPPNINRKLNAQRTEIKKSIESAKAEAGERVLEVTQNQSISVLVSHYRIFLTEKNADGAKQTLHFINKQLNQLRQIVDNNPKVADILNIIAPSMRDWILFNEYDSSNRFGQILSALFTRVDNMLSSTPLLLWNSPNVGSSIEINFNELSSIAKLLLFETHVFDEIQKRGPELLREKCASIYLNMLQAIWTWNSTIKDNIASLEEVLIKAKSNKFTNIHWDTLTRDLLFSVSALKQNDKLISSVALFAHQSLAKLKQISVVDLNLLVDNVGIDLTKMSQVVRHVDFVPAFEKLYSDCCREIKHVRYLSDALKTTSRNADDRDNFYKRVNTALSAAVCCDRILGKGQIGELLDHVKEQIFSISGEGLESIKKEDYEYLNIAVGNLKSMEEMLDADKSLPQFAESERSQIDKMFHSHLSAMRSKLTLPKEVWTTGTWRERVQPTASVVVSMRRLAISVPLYKAKTNDMIDSQLKEYEKESDGFKFISNLATELQKLGAVGEETFQDFPVFKLYKNYFLNELFSKLTIDSILMKPDFRGVDLDKNNTTANRFSVKAAYNEIYSKYQDFCIQGKNDEKFVESIPSSIDMVANTNMDPTTKVRDIVARVFAFWTLTFSSANSYTVGKQFANTGGISYSNSDFFLTKPHTGQIISVIRLLGCDSDMSNKIAQVQSNTVKSSKKMSKQSHIKNKSHAQSFDFKAGL